LPVSSDSGRGGLDGLRQPRPLGSGETGGGTALPIWVRYMQEALLQHPICLIAMPSGVIVARSTR
jgi:penicillin-binding protein 1A